MGYSLLATEFLSFIYYDDLFLLFFQRFKENLFNFINYFSMSFIYLYSNNPNYKPHYGEFLTNTSQIVDYFKSKIKGEEIIAKSRYTKEFENGFLTWKKIRFLEGG